MKTSHLSGGAVCGALPPDSADPVRFSATARGVGSADSAVASPSSSP